MDSPEAASGTTHVLLAGTADWFGPFLDAASSRDGVTVTRAETATAVLEAIDRGTVDCVVTERTLAPEEETADAIGTAGATDPADAIGTADATDPAEVAATAIELHERVQDVSPSVPVVLCTASGSERLASESLAAGIADYVALDEPGSRTFDGLFDGLFDRIDRAVRSAHRAATREERARQFDAIFDDPRTATWVLDTDGALVRANATAAAAIDTDVERLVGEAFWALPWWDDGGEESDGNDASPTGTRADVKALVERAVDGRFGNAVVRRSPAVDARRVIDLSVRPVGDARGDPVSIVVESVDITDRVDLERDLRRSEELHRVTLNNMTDTVLMTDEAGEYTYVCPNVHFVFGYTAAEIRELGTIDDLLGADLFDRDELADAGVLKNIECTATDKAGREHTLLVNVREVSIQDGTVLYSCRDVTKRKQREEALATLQGTAREFLYAETRGEIARHVVDDTAGVLDMEASAVYLFDADANDLRPVARSAAMRDLNGPLPTVHADGGTLPGFSFVGNQPLFFDDVHEADRLENPATGLRSAAYVPLGNHGVLVAGSDEVGVFDGVARELTDLLAATAEAALDRVTRESTLREQDRRLQEQNEQLTRLNRVNETIREIDRAVVRAETREGIDRAVCERLTADDRFAFAWIGTADPARGTVEPRAWGGDEGGYLDSRPFAVAAEGTEPAGRTAATGETTLVADVADGLHEEPWRRDALARDFLSVVSVPLVYNDLTHGVLTVYATTRDAFDGTARAVLSELGETIASALSAIERKNALLTTSVTRVEFAVDDPAFVLSRLARDAECTLSYRGGVQQTADGRYVFVAVSDASVDAVEAAANALVAVDDVRRISADGDGGVLRLRLTQPFLALELADHGALVREATATPGETTLVIDVSESIDVRHITRIVRGTFSDVELRAKRTIDQTADHDLYATFLERLTDRQLEVIQTAYYSGYFESPREHTGEQVAETLGISPTAFYQHARTVQRKLFATLFDEGDPAAATRSE